MLWAVNHILHSSCNKNAPVFLFSSQLGINHLPVVKHTSILPLKPHLCHFSPSKSYGLHQTSACSSQPSSARLLLKGIALVQVFPSALNSPWLPAPSAQFLRQQDTAHPRYRSNSILMQVMNTWASFCLQRMTLIWSLTSLLLREVPLFPKLKANHHKKSWKHTHTHSDLVMVQGNYADQILTIGPEAQRLDTKGWKSTAQDSSECLDPQLQHHKQQQFGWFAWTVSFISANDRRRKTQEQAGKGGTSETVLPCKGTSHFL